MWGVGVGEGEAGTNRAGVGAVGVVVGGWGLPEPMRKTVISRWRQLPKLWINRSISR